MALCRLTSGVVGDSFTLNIRIVFGHGCDCPNYVRIGLPEGRALGTPQGWDELGCGLKEQRRQRGHDLPRARA